MFVPVMAGLGVYSWWQSSNEPVLAPNASAGSAIEDHGNYRLFKPAKALMPFTLEQADGVLSNKDLVGKWTFVVFGYTYCPDVCPTTLTRIKGVYKSLKRSANSQVVFVSADPLRDDVTRLSQYVAYFDSEFIGATTTHNKLFPFAQGLLLPYGIIAQKPSEDYAVSHSASIALINPQGKLHAQFKPSHQLGEVPTVDMKQMAASFAEIVEN